MKEEFDGFIGYGEGIRQAEDVDVFVGFGEGISSEENWGF
ncbi:hypothetical protein [Enterobacter phage EC152]